MLLNEYDVLEKALFEPLEHLIRRMPNEYRTVAYP